LQKRFGDLQVLKRIDAEVRKGEVLAIIGPSGSGKSTFLRCLNFLEQYDAGEVRFNGQLVGYRVGANGGLQRDSAKQIAAVRARMGMVFQSFNLFPHMTVLENVIEGPLIVQRLNRDHAVTRAKALIARVGLADKTNEYPSKLSGGQQQRAAIARALVTDPAMLLADEPTGNLDTASSVEIMKLLSALNADQGRTIVLITHEPDVATFAKRVVELRDGEIVADRRRAA
jgi:polar amino acid transport system ATP-binding protein